MFDNKKNVLVAVLIVGVVAMTVAFAALSTNLRISGTASVPSTNWNIHFDNWALDTASTVTNQYGTQQNTAVYPSIQQLQMSLAPNVTLVEGLNITLYQPNDYAKYTFNIVNDGTIDASLDNFTHTMTCESGKNCDFLEYTVECQDSSLNTVTNGYVLPHGQSVSCYLQLKFKDVDMVSQNTNNINNLQASIVNGVYTQEATSATLAANWAWVQKKDSQANSGSGNNEPVTPSNPYQTTNDGNYTSYLWKDVSTSEYEDDGNGWFTTLNPNSKAYLRTTGSLPEVCGVFPSGLVCMTSSYYNGSYSDNGYYSDFEDYVSGDTVTTTSELASTGLKGYALAKTEEMLNKGASACFVNSAYVFCSMPSGGVCSISDDGGVGCDGGSGSSSVSVYNDGGAD